MGLQTAYYIIGIICMSLITLLLIGLIIGVFIIKAKITHIHDSIKEKIQPVTNVVEKVRDVAKGAKEGLRH